MSRYIVAATPGGYAVAFQAAHGGALIAMSEHPTRESAQAQAERMNVAHEARRMAEARRAAIEEEARLLRPSSRVVRRFEDEREIFA